MKKIINFVQPFDKTQTIYVYEDSNKIATYNPDTIELDNIIDNIIQEYKIQEISFVGPKTYTHKLGEKFLTKYDNEIKVTYLSGKESI